MTPDTTSSDVEVALGRFLSSPVPVRSRGVIDTRVELAIAAEAKRRTGGGHRRVLPWSARRLVVGIAVAVLLTGTVAAGGSLLGQLIGDAPLLENAWDRGTQIGRSVTNSGYTITLERVTADPERIWVAVTGADPGRMRIIDADGLVMDGGTGAGATDGRGASATMFGFRVPSGILPSGPFTLEIRSVMTPTGETPGRWTFTFDVALTPAFSGIPTKATDRPDAN